MPASNENVPPSQSVLMKHLVTSWDYRHPYVLGGVRLAVGIWLFILGVLLCSIGYWLGLLLLVVAAVLFWVGYRVLRIVQG